MSTAIPLDRIYPNPANIRRDLGDVSELAASLRQVGVLQPLVVRQEADGKFRIVDGHRRYEAAILAGLPALPCVATKASDAGAQIEIMLAAAMHKSLEPIEQAAAFKRLRAGGLSPAEIARRTGYSVATVTGRLLLGSLPAEAQHMVRTKELSVGEATALARQVRRESTGQATTSAPRSVWLAPGHRLYTLVRKACDHRATRITVGSAGCGQCWEDAIRADERAHARIGAA